MQFASSVERLAEAGFNVLVEIGPKPVLVNLARACCAPDAGIQFLALQRPQVEQQALIETLSSLYARGVDVDWAPTETPAPARIALPSYPFQRSRTWFQKADTSMTQTSASPIAAAPTHNRSGEILEWLRGKIGELIQADPATINIELPFLEMGADSIVLIEAIRHIEAEYGVKLAMRRFFEDLATVQALAEYVADNLPAAAAPSGAEAVAVAVAVSEPSTPAGRGRAVRGGACAARRRPGGMGGGRRRLDGRARVAGAESAAVARDEPADGTAAHVADRPARRPAGNGRRASRREHGERRTPGGERGPGRRTRGEARACGCRGARGRQSAAQADDAVGQPGPAAGRAGCPPRSRSISRR
ncbi:phosphopantetheine-binding protein [Burkholderia contaminans]|uniref:phosphopantetheine-binding protein n=1 Tax=Burkholderia contaminans TaxID=488447 RepID=UPI001CA7DAEE|nr:phosphopantetheine-binding protein [Burkholderia contaminans]UAC75604.1 hypothetical protein K8B66_31610 [Burkholderia contaminans]